MDEKYYMKQLENKDKIIDEYKRKIHLLTKELDYYKKESSVDFLTKLVNRRGIKNTRIYNSLILGDIDYFKKINDEYGHSIGDNVLVEISRILKSSVGDENLACRWGGEEFLLLFKETMDNELYDKISSIKDEINKLSDDFGFDISMSFGCSDFTSKTFNESLEEADKAMYESKNAGRNIITIYSLK